MLSAPPVIAATIPGILTWAFTPHGRAIRTCSSASAARPARWASAITGTTRGPRHQIRVIERRVDLRQIMQQSHLRGVPTGRERGSFSNSHRPSSEGTFRVDAPE